MCFGGGGGSAPPKPQTTRNYVEDPIAAANRQRAAQMGIGPGMSKPETFGTTLGASAGNNTGQVKTPATGGM
jgi:hypothetical protein